MTHDPASPARLKLAFFGTPDFAVPTLSRLLDGPHEVAAVVTQPDKPAGRGRKLTPPPVKVLAEEYSVPVFQPDSVRKPGFAELVAGWGIDAAVVVAYGKILPLALLQVPRHGFFNVHASLLPKYRGAAPIQWALANGETTTGVTIMQLDEGMDTGPVVDSRQVEVLDDDDAQSIHDMLSMVGAELMAEVLDRLAAQGQVTATEQDHDAATYAPLIKREDAHIDWHDPEDRIVSRIRAFSRWPGAFTELDGRDGVKIDSADGAPLDAMTVEWRDERVPEGMVVEIIKGRGAAVKCGGDGLVLVKSLKIPGKRVMSVDDAVNGGMIDIGSRFGGPAGD